MSRYDEPTSFSGQAKGIIVAGHFQVNDQYVVNRQHGMSDWLIAYTLSGEGYFGNDERTVHCTSGDIVLLKAGVPHQYGTVKGEVWNFVWSHFSTAAFGDTLLPTDSLFFQSLQSESLNKRIYRAFRKILSDSRERNEYWHDLCLNSLREILILLAQKRRQSLDPRVEEMLHYLSSNMKQRIGIDEIARSIGISPSRLSHLVKEQTGVSIIDHLNQMRIRQAAILLEHSNRTATEIAYEVGFNNYNHFIKQFHRWHGTAPSQFKRSISTGNNE